MNFTDGNWTVVGEASDVRRSGERGAILDVLRASIDPMSPADVAGALGKSSGAVKKMMFTMAKAAEIERVSRGRYCASKVGNLGNRGNQVEKHLQNQFHNGLQKGYRDE